MSTYYTYDEYGRVLGIADETLASNGEYNAIKYIYNSYGELIGAVPATYDKQDNVLTEVTGGKRVDYTYNDKHILSEIISPSTEYNMVYNDFNAIDQILIGNTAIATYEYVQNNGNLKKTTLANGAYIEYTYDSVDRLVGVCYNGIEEARFVYSSSGSLSSIVDVDNSTTYSYYYSGAGKLISERMSNANGLVSQRSYEYDVHDRLSKRCVIYFDAEYSKEQTEEYYYNTDGNVERIVRGERNECGLEYTYDGLGRLSTQVKKGSDFLTTQYEYANLDTHISSIITKTTTNGETTSYDYDKAGNITSITLPTGKKITYTYDNTSQLIREDNEPLGVSYKYNYDSAGNLTSVEEYAYTVKSTALSGTPTSTYAYTYGNSNWGDLLTKYRGVSNTYDQLGNPLTYYNGTSYAFTWNEGRQLASATLNGSTFTYKYNQDGIRVEKIANGVKHTYYLNGTQIEREVQSNATTGELIRDLRYYYDIMGIASHIEIYDSIGTRIKFTLETNIQGDVVAIYTDALTKVASYQYDAWGKCTTLNPDGTENVNSSFIGNINPFRYRGYYYDTDTGFYYLNSRYYDPQVKRFINADDISYLGANGDLEAYNLYAYCSNNPVMYTDPSGNLPSWAIKLIVAASIVVAVAAIAAITVATAGTGTAIAAVAVGAAKGAAIGFASGAAMGAASGAISHRVSTGSWEGAGEAALNGMADGALSGAITGAISGGISGYSNYSSTANFLKSNGANPKEVLSSYKGTPRVQTLKADTTVYRTWGGTTQELGHWVSPNNYGSNARNLLSLPAGNTTANMSFFLLPKGTNVLVGKAAPLFGQSGGGVQWWVSVLG